MARADAAGDQGSAGEADVPGEAHRLLGEGSDDALLARGAQRVHEDCRAHCFSGGEERLETRIADRGAIHMARDLDAGEAELAAVLELADGGIHILQGHGAEADEALGRLAEHRGDGVVQIANQRARVVERQPVREELRHRRDRLARDAHRAHVLDAPRHAPAAVGDRAIDLPGNHDVPMARVRRCHRRPRHVVPFAFIGRKIFRDDVRVDIDAVGRHAGNYRIDA